jgi:endonuclease-3
MIQKRKAHVLGAQASSPAVLPKGSSIRSKATPAASTKGASIPRKHVLGAQASSPATSTKGASVRSKQARTPALPGQTTEPLEALKKRTREIIRKLKQAYPDAKCSLNHSNPFELLVATILSAQCTDERVNIVTADLFRKYRKPEDYLKVSPRELEKDIQSTGFFRNKTKSIQGTSKVLTESYGGEVPQTMDELLELPGVARKTANVVLGNAFDIASGVVVDTHVTRLSHRLNLTQEKTAEKIEQESGKASTEKRLGGFLAPADLPRPKDMQGA